MSSTTPRKFRVWDGEEMHEPPHNYVLDSKGRLLDRWGPSGNAYIGGELDGKALFSTGLTDAEGIEIWEGDIIAFENTIQTVGWDSTGGGYRIGATPLTEDIPEIGGTVIGDRYRNPGLLDEVSAHD